MPVKKVRAKKASAEILGDGLDWVLETTSAIVKNGRDPSIVLAAAATAMNLLSENGLLVVRKNGPGVATNVARIEGDQKIALPLTNPNGPIKVNEKMDTVGLSYARVALIGDETIRINEVYIGKQQGVICMARVDENVIIGLNKEATLELNIRELLSGYSLAGRNRDGLAVSMNSAFRNVIERIGKYEDAAEAIEVVKRDAVRLAEEAEAAARRAAVEARAEEYGSKGWGVW